MAVPAPIIGGAATSGADEAERRLHALLRSMDGRDGAIAIHLHLSAFHGLGGGAEVIHRVARPFSSLQAMSHAHVLRLANRDIVLVCQDIPFEIIDKAVAKAHSLFASDAVPSAQDNRFATWYDLRQEADVRVVLDLVARYPPDGGTPAADTIGGAGPSPPPHTRRLCASDLGVIRQRLDRARWHSCVRQQTALEIRSDGHASPVLRETYVSLRDLETHLALDVDLTSDRWLLRHLTEQLDHRMLDLIAAQRLPPTPTPISVNLNARTVVADAFRSFHKEHSGAPEQLLVEIHLTDVLADLRTFGHARDILRRLGYRVLIDGVCPLTPSYVNLRKLRPDLVKIWWNPRTLDTATDQHVTRLRNFIDEQGRSNIILARADSEAAVHWALRLGVRRFQGFFIDRLATALGGSAAP